VSFFWRSFVVFALAAVTGCGSALHLGPVAATNALSKSEQSHIAAREMRWIPAPPSLQSVLAADAAKYGAAVTFNVIQGASSQNVNAEAHYATHSIDFYTYHSGDGAQVLEHEGLRLFDEKPIPQLGFAPIRFQGKATFNLSVSSRLRMVHS
jgi:hypothetical protein